MRSGGATDGPTLRETRPWDLPEILGLYAEVFPDEDLVPLVRDLMIADRDVLSLAAFDGDSPTGHVLFTLFGTPAKGRTAALLGPLGVLPRFQRLGLGTSLVRAGLDRLKDQGVEHVFVLGDPAYYGRFGFARERRATPPFPIPDAWSEAWQSAPLVPDAPMPDGPIAPPAPWMRPALWAP